MQEHTKNIKLKRDAVRRQKLICFIKRFPQRGATLAGTTVLIVALTFMGASLLRLAVNSAVNETDELDEARAFLAAESGALMGARWLKGYTISWPTEGWSLTPGCLTNVPINNHFVTVTLTADQDSTTGDDLVRIESEAFTTTTNNAASFAKRILRNAGQDKIENYATFIHKIDEARTSFKNRTWNGRFHLNEAIRIHSKENTVRFTGKVTVANAPNEHWDYGDGGPPHYNNYDYGVQLAEPGGFSGDKAVECDTIFQAVYLANQDQKVLPQEIQELPTALPTRADLTVITLPGVVYDPQPGNSKQYANYYRPTLEYNADGSATYYYKPDKNSPEQTYTIENIDQTVIYSVNNINVRGTVKGNSTLVTSSDRSIVLTGDLVYHGFVPEQGTNGQANYGISEASGNMLGLVSGKHLVIPDTWADPDGNSVTLTGTLRPNQLFLNASLLAISEEATELWDHSKIYPFEFIFTGNHILDTYDQPSAGATHGPSHIWYNHDQRLLKGLLVPYGFPGTVTPNANWDLVLTNWREENNY